MWREERIVIQYMVGKDYWEKESKSTVSHNPHLLISHIVIVVVNPILKEHRVAMDTTYSPRSRYQLLSSLCSLPINATEGMNDSDL